VPRDVSLRDGRVRDCDQALAPSPEDTEGVRSDRDRSNPEPRDSVSPRRPLLRLLADAAGAVEGALAADA
jgi:hypothetical protein